MLYGKFGEKVDLSIFMIASGTPCLCCYLLAIRNTKQNDPDGENEDFGRVE